MNFKKELSYDDDLKVEDYLKKSFTGNDRKHLPLPVIAQKIVRNGCTKDLLMMNVLSVFATVILFLPPSSEQALKFASYQPGKKDDLFIKSIQHQYLLKSDTITTSETAYN
ncbi:245_t:CDS:2, partial [Funneliformis geosporum]